MWSYLPYRWRNHRCILERKRLVCCCVYTSYSAVLCVWVRRRVCSYVFTCMWCDRGELISIQTQYGELSRRCGSHTPHTHTHSARHQPPSPQSCHANHLNSTIKANKMFHVGRKSREKWLSVFVNVTELKGALILIFSPVSSDSWFNQQSCKKLQPPWIKVSKEEEWDHYKLWIVYKGHVKALVV